jgi:hypothetical protein
MALPPSFLEDVERAKRGVPGEDVATKLGDLGLLTDDIAGLSWEAEGLRAIGRARSELDAAAVPQTHAIVFTGHRLDAPGRAKPRFPASAEGSVADEIGRALDAIVAEHGHDVIGIAGAASGGDILFQEACVARGIASKVYLALPAEQYAAASVDDGGPEWTARFYRLLESHPPRVLQPSKELPPWLAERAPDYTVWQRNNLWTLRRGLVFGGGRMTLLALWDGKGGDGPGGTADMVEQARTRGAKVVLLGAELFGARDAGQP